MKSIRKFISLKLIRNVLILFGITFVIAACYGPAENYDSISKQLDSLEQDSANHADTLKR